MATNYISGSNSYGETEVRVSALPDGTVRLRIGQRRGIQGRTRYIDLAPEQAAEVVEQLGKAISAVLSSAQIRELPKAG